MVLLQLKFLAVWAKLGYKDAQGAGLITGMAE